MSLFLDQSVIISTDSCSIGTLLLLQTSNTVLSSTYLNMGHGVCKAPVTPGLRPGYDLPGTEKWANRRKNVRLVAEVVRLVAEVVGDRKGQISRNKVVVMFKTRSHRAYDKVTTYLRSKNVGMMGQS